MSARETLVEFARRLRRDGYVVATQGNLSLRVGPSVLITPSGVPYESLTPSSIARIDPDGTHGGRHAPSSERALHLAIYRARPEVNAIVHAHPLNVCALAVAGIALPSLLEEVEAVLGGEVRVAEYAPSGTATLGDNAVDALAGRNAAILAHHGSVTIGSDLLAAYHRLEVLERAAAVYILSARLQ